ncbi:MAG: ABC transporter ATP-binding protein [Spirochaetia bacterium]|jgi:iron complex transport system ATP-binding protein|nr:ABC transporter ATP-binding protein [Spirochaetia bacterium]
MKDNKGMILEISNLATGYKTGKTLRQVTRLFSTSISKGKIISLIGPNGCGKTTLLKTISGMIKPLSGTVFYSGGGITDDISKMSSAELASRRALVLTKPPEPGMMSVSEIVSLGRAPHTNWKGKLSEKDKEAIHNSLAITGSSPLSERIFRTLSDGEKQKVMLSRALAQDTPLIFLDEPAAFLDLPSRMELAGLLAGIRDKGEKTLLITTHDIDFALKYSDIMWIIDSKGAVYDGLPDNLALDGTIGRVFSRGEIIFNIEKRQFEHKKLPD